MNLLPQYIIALSITSVTLFVLGLFVFSRNPKSKLYRVFALFVGNAAIWSGGTAFAINAPDKSAALFWTHLFHSGVVFIGPCFLHFVFTLLGIKKRHKIILVIYVFAFFFLVCNYTRFLLADVVTPKMSLKYYFEPGIVYPLFLLFWLSCVSYGLFELFKAYRHSSGAKRNQLKYLWLGTLIGFSGGISNYLPAFNIEFFPYSPFGTYGVPIFSIMMAYAIIKFRLMDINIVIGKLAVYSFLLAILSGVYLGLVWGVDKAFAKFSAHSPFAPHFLIFLFLSIALIYFIPRIKRETGEGIEKVFFKNKFKYREALREFSKKLVLIPDEEQLLTESVSNIATTMGVSKVAIMLADDLSGNYIVRASYGLDEEERKLAFTPQDGIIQWLRSNRRVFFVEEADKILSREELEKIKIELKDKEAVIYLPLIIHNELGGALLLGEKLTREMFSHIDIELLEDFTGQLALSISYKRLESRMMRADRLVSLGTLAAGVAHEIRNPLSSIQIFAQLLPEKYDDKEFREEFSKIVASDTQRISRIIESVMALANPKPSVPVACDANKLVDEALFLIESNIKKNGVKVNQNYDGQLPQIKVDKEQLKQVFINIFLNALTVLNKGDGQLTISTRQKFISAVTSGKKDKYVQVEIRDNGVGIEKKLLEKIFEPFFTTRADGTGLGLAIVHRIIEQHKGFIEVDSELGKGTAFFINLPC